MTVDVSGELKRAADRYHRQTLIEWWDQRRVRDARILVIGAGALGNEILKLLALLGVGHTVVYDLDLVERSNLSRCVLFRDEDEGQPKAQVAARRMVEINPEVAVQPRRENILVDAGLGVFHWADVVIAGVDNREARMFVNSACARTGRSWVDGAIEGLSGVARVFHPRATACYECTMNATDRRLVAERRSCALVARAAVARGHVPTTAVAASMIAALQVQEAIKLLHGQPALWGEGLHVAGLWNDVHRVSYPRIEDCMGHDDLGEIVPLGAGAHDLTFAELLRRAARELGDGAVLDLSRDVVVALECPGCRSERAAGVPVWGLAARVLACPACGQTCVARTATSVSGEDRALLSRTPGDAGLPPFDVIVARRGLSARRAWLFDGDAAAVLGRAGSGRTS